MKPGRYGLEGRAFFKALFIVILIGTFILLSMIPFEEINQQVGPDQTPDSLITTIDINVPYREVPTSETFLYAGLVNDSVFSIVMLSGHQSYNVYFPRDIDYFYVGHRVIVMKTTPKEIKIKEVIWKKEF